jgi:hypothetical protein
MMTPGAPLALPPGAPPAAWQSQIVGGCLKAQQ